MPSNIRRRHVEVSPEILEHLRGLTEAARRCNRHTEPNTRDYIASHDLTWLLTYLVKQRLVSVRYLARELDISPSAISQRVKEGTDNWQTYTQSSGVIRPED